MDKLGIDIKLLIAQLVNFGLFFFIVQRFIAKPFLKLIKSEEKKEKEKLAFEEAMNKQKEHVLEEQAKAKEHLNKQKKELLDEVKQEADLLKKSLLEDAKKEASDYITQAHQQIEEDLRAQEQTLKRKAADLSLLIVKQGFKDYLSEDAQKEMTKHIISQVKN